MIAEVNFKACGIRAAAGDEIAVNCCRRLLLKAGKKSKGQPWTTFWSLLVLATGSSLVRLKEVRLVIDRPKYKAIAPQFVLDKDVFR